MFFTKIHVKTSLLESFLNNVAGFNAWNFIKRRLWHRYLPVNFLQFFKQPYLKKISGWLLLLIPLLQPKFYPLITLCWFFSSLFSFIFDNRNYGSLLKKCPKMKTFLLFTIIYSKININFVKKIQIAISKSLSSFWVLRSISKVEHQEWLLTPDFQKPWKWEAIPAFRWQ